MHFWESEGFKAAAGARSWVCAPASRRDDVDHRGNRIDWGRWAITSNDPDFKGEGNPDTGEDYGAAPGARGGSAGRGGRGAPAAAPRLS